MRLKPLLTYLFFFSCLSLQAQEYNIDVKKWGIEDGLPDRRVGDICKDKLGFIWLCTGKGLVRFDGHNFKLYSKEKGNIPNNFLTRMVIDGDGKFWIVSEFNAENNLFIFDPLSERSISLAEKTGYREKFNCYYLHPLNDSTILFGNNSGSRFFTWTAHTGLHQFKCPVSIGQFFFTTDHQSFWIVDSSDHFCEINSKGNLLQSRPHAEHSWPGWPFIYLDGLHQYWKPMAGQEQSQQSIFEVAVVDSMARFCMRNSSGGMIYSKSVGDYPLNEKLHLKEIFGKVEDENDAIVVWAENDNEVWIGSHFGLYHVKIRKNNFHNYFYKPGAKYGNAFRGLVVKDHVLYAALEAAGIAEANLISGKETAFNPLPENGTAHALLHQASNGLIIGLEFGTLYLHDKNWQLRGDEKNWGPFAKKGMIWTLSEIAKDSFLAGTEIHGLCYYNLERHATSPFTKYNSYPELVKATVLDISNDGNSRWICSNKGLYVFDEEKGITERYSSNDTGRHYIPTSDIQHLYKDPQGIYWLATVNGLIRWDKQNNKHRLFSTTEGLSSNNIYAVYEDKQNRLWLSSEYGLMVFDKKTFAVRTYLVNDGISYNEFNRVSHTQDAEGNLYFGGLNGVTAFHPSDFQAGDGKAAPKLVLSSFEQFDAGSDRIVTKTNELLNTTTITVQPGDRFLDFEFALLNFDDAIHNTYYWKIAELDSGWTSLRGPSLRLSALPYGNLTLTVKANAGDGQTGANELVFKLIVLKPVYLRNWFLALMALLIIGLIFAGYRWRIYRLKKENERLDRTVKEKTSDLEKKTTTLEETVTELNLSVKQKEMLMKEIHHRVKNNLQVISSLLNLQLENITDQKAKTTIEEGVSRILSIALIHHHLYKGDDLNSVEVSSFAAELFRQVSDVYLKPGQRATLQNEITETNLDLDTALPVGLILNELMTNSFKYAFSGKEDCVVKMRLLFTDGIYKLYYTDHGPGLPDDYKPNEATSLGMVLMNSLSQQMMGSFSYNAVHNRFEISFMDATARKVMA